MSLSVKVGSFAKTASAAVASQSVTGLGFQPKAIFFFSVAQTSSGVWAGGIIESLGVTAGAAQSGAIAGNLPDASTAGTAGRTAAKALTFCDIVGGAIAEASLTSFDADGFTLSWTTNNPAAYVIHYLALGGADLTNAAVVSWNTPASAVSQSVTGVGFTPDCLLHLFGTTSAGSQPYQGMGVMTAAGDQWALDQGGYYIGGATKASCCLDPTVGVLRHNSFAQAADVMLGLASMDSGGFTVSGFLNSASAVPVYTLCLKGASFKAGTFGKTAGAATATQAVLSTAFRPSALLLGTDSQTNSSLKIGQRFCVGATDGTNSHGVAMTFKDGAASSVAKTFDSTTKCVVKADNDASTTEALANVSSLDTNGFALSWTTNDAAHANIGYLAIGPAATTSSGGGTRAYGFAG